MFVIFSIYKIRSQIDLLHFKQEPFDDVSTNSAFSKKVLVLNLCELKSDVLD